MKRLTDTMKINHQIRSMTQSTSDQATVGHTRFHDGLRGFFRRHLVQISYILCLSLICGCATFDLSKRIPWMDSDEITLPTKITTLWTHTILNQSGQKGVRGFGGRIMFHGKENEKPVRVEGTLIIYAFDETDRVNSVPERKFVFTPEQFEKHYSLSKLGHSYSIWIPWDEVGGRPRRINLLARFEPVDGGMVMSENSLQLLPGISPTSYEEKSEELESAERASEVEQAKFQRPASLDRGHDSQSRPLMEDADTINLPLSFSRRLNAIDEVPALKIRESRIDSSVVPANYTEPGVEPAQRDQAELPGTSGAAAAAKGERTNSESTTSQKALMARQRELSDHFGRRKSQVQKASTARSRLAPPQNPQLPADEPSLP